MHKKEKVNFDKVLMSNGVAGNPYVEGARVEGKVVKNGKGKKIKIFTYKQKKTTLLTLKVFCLQCMTAD